MLYRLKFILLLGALLSIAQHLRADEEHLKLLYQDPMIESLVMSPSGRYAAAIYNEDDMQYIDVYNLENRKGNNIQTAGDDLVDFKRLLWIDENSFLVFWKDIVLNAVSVFHLEYDDEQGVKLAEKFRLPQLGGRIINALPHVENKVIFAETADNGPGYERFYMLDLSVELKRKAYLKRHNQLPIKLKNVTDTAFDGNDQLRFVEAKVGEKFVYWYQNPETKLWKIIAEKELDEIAFFFFLDSSERVLALVTDNQDKKVLAYYSTEDLTRLEVVYAHDKYDVQYPLYDENRNLIGAVVVNEGIHEQIFFDQQMARLKDRVIAEKGFLNGFIVDSSQDRKKMLILGTKNGFHYRYYDFNQTLDKTRFIIDPQPWLKGRTFSETKTISFTNKAGQTIEAYLTLPGKFTGRLPLLVKPHGGPISVRDYRYSEDIDYLASQNFAVLRVNFRGSSGFGIKFIESAKKGFGTIIEEDIHQALEIAMRDYPIDPSRVCAIGTSYGGYSTAMLLAKHPDIFKCGVSFAGVFDINLQTNESKRFAVEKEGLEEYFREFIADLEKQPELQEVVSPVYYAEKINAPLMLLHGDQDDVVDIEQSYRMHYALQRAGKKSQLEILENYPHGFNSLTQRIEYYKLILPFLEKHLQ